MKTLFSKKLKVSKLKPIKITQKFHKKGLKKEI